MREPSRNEKDWENVFSFPTREWEVGYGPDHSLKEVLNESNMLQDHIWNAHLSRSVFAICSWSSVIFKYGPGTYWTYNILQDNSLMVHDYKVLIWSRIIWPRTIWSKTIRRGQNLTKASGKYRCTLQKGLDFQFLFFKCWLKIQTFLHPKCMVGNTNSNNAQKDGNQTVLTVTEI